MPSFILYQSIVLDIFPVSVFLITKGFFTLLSKMKLELFIAKAKPS